MQNSLVVLLALVGFSSAGLLTGVVDTVKSLPKAASPLLGALSDGISIPLPTGKNFVIGAVALPLSQLCNLTATQTLVCILCSIDCTAVHNRYGGQCAPDPKDSTQGTCLCNDSPPPSGNVPTATQNCGLMVDPVTDAVITAALSTVFTTRETTVQCTPTLVNGVLTVGCNSDCYVNHQYNSGTCKQQTPVPTTNSSTPGQERQFCVCT